MTAETYLMTPGPCLWCEEYVESGRDIAGSTNPLDPAWHNDGDFGCDDAPEATNDACGNHARPYDLAIILLKK